MSNVSTVRFFMSKSVWNPSKSQVKKKNIKENDFLLSDFNMDNIKENQVLHFFKFLSPCAKRNKHISLIF